jgi:lambda repressor-like predicted transcriptional regulator
VKALGVDGYLGLRALARYSGLSVRTLRGYLHDPARPLPHYRIGGKILVRPCEFDAWAARFRVEQRGVEQLDRAVAEIMAGLRR